MVKGKTNTNKDECKLNAQHRQRKRVHERLKGRQIDKKTADESKTATQAATNKGEHSSKDTRRSNRLAIKPHHRCPVDGGGGERGLDVPEHK